MSVACKTNSECISPERCAWGWPCLRLPANRSASVGGAQSEPPRQPLHWFFAGLVERLTHEEKRALHALLSESIAP